MTHRKKPSRFSLLLLAAAILLSVPLVLGFLGRFHPALDSFSHFRAHIAVAMAVLALPLFFTALWREAAMVLLLSLSAFATTLGVSQAFLSGAARAGGAETNNALYSLIQLNLRYDNSDPAEVLRMVAREKPDIITVEEVSGQWQEKLKLLEGRYPYSQYCRRTGGWGVAILSRRPFVEGSRSGCVGGGIMAFARFDLGGAPLSVVALHLPWPWPFNQPGNISFIAPHLANQEGPLIVAGDFNAAPWSNAVRRVEAITGTRHIAGIGPTFAPRQFPAGLIRHFGLPIDQVLTSPGIANARIAALYPVGSDHLPVRLDFSLAAPARDDESVTQTVMY
jgi:endonuclease/exonuclease/phosphatase (EEP) superfamily protein YafD